MYETTATFTYKGWSISHQPSAPVTGTWRAERFGVGMCAGSKELLLKMVDAKVANQITKGR